MSDIWTKEQREKLYREAKDAWGEMSQADMFIEELTECSLASQKLFKRRYDVERLIELASEIADVRITMEEVILLLDETQYLPDGYDFARMGSFSDLVEQQMDYKLNRLALRLEKHKTK